MINVQYPFTDLTKALLTLIQTLKPTDWDKTTLFKNYQISLLITHLLKVHIDIIAHPHHSFTPNIDNNDTALTRGFVENQVKEIKEILVKDKKVSQVQYSHCWLVQQYIRQALNNQDLLQRIFYFPFLDATMNGFVSYYLAVDAEKGTIIKVEIVGEAGAIWAIEKAKIGWQKTSSAHTATTTLYLDQQIAWLLFANSLHVNEIGQYYQIIGNKLLGSHFLNMRTTAISQDPL
ncbi:MAG TPA: hypothetical protein VFM79_01910 [Pelobium sp.]|nr:hypothetical protein [Pelobium sp.]